MNVMDEPIIREVIIENFMSYEYARIPFKNGINIISGPNGSGKSSILLALAVALGQTYTERGRKLSDLIRRGRDLARVTVVINNSPRNGVRPIPRYRIDDIYVSRYLKSDGSYWHEINYRVVSKGEVERLLSHINLNPNNSLIIMHQNMIEEFAVISPIERLRLIEEAVGISGYRDRIIESMRNLETVIGEEKEVKNMLEKAYNALHYWEDKYKRFQEKLRLLDRLKNLRCELAWLKYDKKMKEIENLEERVGRMKAELIKYKSEFRRNEEDIAKIEGKINILYDELHRLLKKYIQHLREYFRVKFAENRDDKRLQDVCDELYASYQLRNSELRRMWNLLVEQKSKEAILSFKIEILQKNINDLLREISRHKSILNELEKNARELGPRVVSNRKIIEVEDEIKSINVKLTLYSDINRDVVEVYEKYLKSIEELENRARIVAEDKNRVMIELEKRKAVWKKRLIELVSEVDKTYKELLEYVDAIGEIRVINIDDIENAGLELLVGFRNMKPTTLDAYIQSGGERTTAIMCFLLALQQHIKSPLRAIDEFDVHMDPSNREKIMEMLFNIAERSGGQYIIITPGYLVNVRPNMNIILVQRVGEVSTIRETISVGG